MNIVYLLIHKTRLEDNNPPYYYIGSKMRWKGDNSYKSSSRHEIATNAYDDDLILVPIWSTEECTVHELCEVEKNYQIAHDVLNNPLFFNRNIANSRMYCRTSLPKRIESFKKVANSVDENGVKLSTKWAKKARAAIENKYTKEELSKAGKERQYKTHESGKLVKEVVHERMMETMSRVDESGLTGFQRAGKKLSEVLNSECPVTGMTLAQKRTYFGYSDTRLEMFGFCFFSKQAIKEVLGFDKATVDRILSGRCSKSSYVKLVNFFGEDYLKGFSIRIKDPGEDFRLSICGEVFENPKQMQIVLGIKRWVKEDYSKSGKPNKYMKAAIIERYGADKYYEYYPEE